MSFRQGLIAILTVCAVSSCSAAAASAGQQDTVASLTHASLSAGMGVSYLSPADLVDLVNASTITGERQSEFKSAVVFFGSAHVPLSPDWALKVDYGFLLGSYTIAGFFGTSEYAFSAHLPSVLLQYSLALEQTYSVFAGFGGGYHFGRLQTTLQPFENTYTGAGPGMLFDLEANTAFGDNLFGYLGLEVRWEFIGALTDSAGRSPGPGETTLNSFGIGIRFGFSYYL
jgi:hypothetical protein